MFCREKPQASDAMQIFRRIRLIRMWSYRQNFSSERGEDYVARTDLRQTVKGWRADRQQLIRMCGEVVHADKGVVEELLPLAKGLLD